MKEKKKLSLAAQIFIALVLAVIAGLLMQKYANFAETYIKPFGTICVRQHLPLHSDLLGQICSKEHFRRLRQQIFLIKQIRRSH